MNRKRLALISAAGILCLGFGGCVLKEVLFAVAPFLT